MVISCYPDPFPLTLRTEESLYPESYDRHEKEEKDQKIDYIKNVDNKSEVRSHNEQLGHFEVSRSNGATGQRGNGQNKTAVSDFGITSSSFTTGFI